MVIRWGICLAGLAAWAAPLQAQTGYVPQLGANDVIAMKTQARLRAGSNDFEGALPLVEMVLAKSGDDQEAWLLRADCAHHLDRWNLEAESLERAIALGPVPVAKRTDLIAGYLGHGEATHALPHLQLVMNQLPPEAQARAQYASFWEEEHDAARAETLWKASLDADAKYEPAYFGLTRLYLANKRVGDAVQVVNRGLEAAPGSLRLALLKEDALEASGSLYSARRFINQRVPAVKDIELLKR
ncbi:MAG: tetratricopeptide repeat protein [Acidobacteriaceae bacterium]|nr:tetratricopeptide repeat protein [Acidobacteriaceae bacterium]MBV9763506.1 tetratricopeptide repeat protein [Acidobacteriaceae bacterium]